MTREAASTFPALDDAWALHGRWSAVATQQHGRVAARRTMKLGLLLVAAVAGGVAALVDDPDWVSSVGGIVASLSLAASAFIQQRGLSADAIRRWTLARVASETLKAECYRVMAGVAPYDDAGAAAHLRQRIDQVQNSMGEHLLALHEVTADSARLRPSISGIEDYVEHRARDQADWHRGKIGDHTSRARRLGTAELVVTIGGAVVAAAGALFDHQTLGIVIGIATTIAAALGVHREATRHDRIAASYARTVEQLDRLIAALADHPSDPVHDDRFVTEVEGVLAREVEGWVNLIPQDASS